MSSLKRVKSEEASRDGIGILGTEEEEDAEIVAQQVKEIEDDRRARGLKPLKHENTGKKRVKLQDGTWADAQVKEDEAKIFGLSAEETSSMVKRLKQLNKDAEAAKTSPKPVFRKNKKLEAIINFMKENEEWKECKTVRVFDTFVKEQFEYQSLYRTLKLKDATNPQIIELQQLWQQSACCQQDS